MKVETYLKFDNDDRSDEMKMMRCLKATDAYLVLWDLRTKLFGIKKNINNY
jgi:hypothetical protein